jgi:putative ABC transport system substrate-binding protein
MKRREFITLLGCAAASWPLAARGQPQAGVRRIGLMANLPLKPIEHLRRKLKDLGYVEGQNLVIEYRGAEGRDDHYDTFAAEFLKLPVDMIVTWGTPASLAAKRATSTVPILIAAIGDVLNTGIVSNLARPGGNITGFSAVNVELEEKRLEILKVLLPDIKRVGVLANALNALNGVNLETARRIAKNWSITIDAVEIRGSAEIDEALRKLVGLRPDAILIASDILLLSARRKIVDAMAAARIPAIYPFPEYVEAGAFIVHGANLSVLFERAAVYVDKILRGEKPGDLPVQQATAFELVINLKAATALGITVPPMLLVRADEVIE